VPSPHRTCPKDWLASDNSATAIAVVVYEIRL
jgi:hypothetical protein